MSEEKTDWNLQLLVSSIVNEKRFSHCRLCLKYNVKPFVQFHDLVTLDSSIGEFTPLKKVIVKIFGSMFEEIPGIDTVCQDCVDKALQTLKFMDECHDSNKKLISALDKLSEKLTNFDLKHNNQSMYIVVEEQQSNLILIQKENSKSKPKKKTLDCLKCNERLGSFDQLSTHNFSLHGYLTCEICHSTFFDNTELSDHLKCQHKQKCPHCDYRRDTQKQLEKHIHSVHGLYVCKECGITCSGLDRLRAHEYRHKQYKKNQECPKCGKIYTTKEFYHKHVKLCSENLIDPHPIRNEIQKNFCCKLCGKAYSSPGGLRVHDRFSHGNAQHHVCNQCGKKFTAPSYLKMHMITHTGVKNFKCDICGNKFVSKEALLYHTRRHTGEKPYSCKLCSERFVNASARAEHVKFKHVGPTLMCEICSQKFVTVYFLRQHMNRHRDPTNKLYVSRDYPDTPGEQRNLKRKKNTTIDVPNCTPLEATLPLPGLKTENE